MTDFVIDTAVTTLAEALGENAGAKEVLDSFKADYGRVVGEHKTSGEELETLKTVSVETATAVETATKASADKVEELNETLIKSAAAIKELTAKVDGTTENSAKMAQLETDLGVRDATITTLTDQLKAGTVKALVAHGFKEEDIKGSSPEILAAMLQGATQSNPVGTGTLPIGTGLPGSGETGTTKKTAIEQAGNELAEARRKRAAA